MFTCFMSPAVWVSTAAVGYIYYPQNTEKSLSELKEIASFSETGVRSTNFRRREVADKKRMIQIRDILL